MAGKKASDETWEKEVSKHLKESKPEKKEKTKKTNPLVLIAFFLIALIPRMYFIFFVSTPDNPGAGWFGDAYHHWQIAYLTREIGLHKGFLRLWDLKGMEYFWGALHPFLTMLAFALTGSISVGVERGMTAVFGSISVVLIYLLGKKYWNTKVAVAAALFAALTPVGIFNDGTGMVEPVGIPFLLLGVYLWPKKPFLSGVSFVLALMARAEYWVFALGMIVAMTILSKKVKFDKKVVLLGGFFILLLIYMKYLLDHTGNPIYPFYWNYITNIFGTWQLKTELTAQDIQAKYTFLGIFLISLAAALIVFWKKPKGKYLYLLGIGNWLFLGATFGLGQYIKSYASYVWYVRFMILPYAFLGILLAVGLFYAVPKVKGLRLLDKLKLNWLIFIAVLVASQYVWTYIWPKYYSTEQNWDNVEKIADQLAPHYNGGGLLFVEGNPELTYALVKEHGLEGKNITGEMFDPYFYFPEDEDPYADWGEKRKIVLNWLKENNVQTIITYQQYDRYQKLAEHEPEYFSDGTTIKNTNFIVFQVKEKLYQDEIPTI